MDAGRGTGHGMPAARIYGMPAARVYGMPTAYAPNG